MYGRCTRPGELKPGRAPQLVQRSLSPQCAHHELIRRRYQPRAIPGSSVIATVIAMSSSTGSPLTGIGRTAGPTARAAAPGRGRASGPLRPGQQVPRGDRVDAGALRVGRPVGDGRRACERTPRSRRRARCRTGTPIRDRLVGSCRWAPRLSDVAVPGRLSGRTWSIPSRGERRRCETGHPVLLHVRYHAR